ncbi:hypothetical protein K438DRAFT_1780535 [Mycena galopus ATCC 62051]|nr:hypothetical protein K438DRAFT_1780535 [Mycena galopus ATCC 62051]
MDKIGINRNKTWRPETIIGNSWRRKKSRATSESLLDLRNGIESTRYSLDASEEYTTARGCLRETKRVGRRGTVNALLKRASAETAKNERRRTAKGQRNSRARESPVTSEDRPTPGSAVYVVGSDPDEGDRGRWRQGKRRRGKEKIRTELALFTRRKEVLSRHTRGAADNRRQLPEPLRKWHEGEREICESGLRLGAPAGGEEEGRQADGRTSRDEETGPKMLLESKQRSYEVPEKPVQRRNRKLDHSAQRVHIEEERESDDVYDGLVASAKPTLLSFASTSTPHTRDRPANFAAPSRRSRPCRTRSTFLLFTGLLQPLATPSSL